LIFSDSRKGDSKMRKFLTAAVLVTAFFVAACSWTDRLFGVAETPDRKAFKLTCEYVYLGIPAANYTEHASAKPEVVAAIQRNDARLHQAMMTARASLSGGADSTTATLAGMGSALASYSLQLTGSAIIPDDPAALAGRAIIIASVLTKSAAEMRLWRKGYCQRKLEDFDANDRAPTEDEWAEVDTTLTDIRSRIQRLPE
jgi:hypothetical protein